MSWNPNAEVHYVNTSYPYSNAGSFMEYFEGLTYEHVNFIFSGASQTQESIFTSPSTSFYKFGSSEPGSSLYYDVGHGYEVHDYDLRNDLYRRPHENSPIMTNEQTTPANSPWESTENVHGRDIPVECPRRHHSSHDYQAVWQDNIDPDNMTYEELLELGEAVGTQSRGLSQKEIALLPVSKYKCSFFSRKKSRDERCVICQMEYKRNERRMTLPCKHAYHSSCANKWLTINKACPICYKEVKFGDASKR